MSGVEGVDEFARHEAKCKGLVAKKKALLLSGQTNGQVSNERVQVSLVAEENIETIPQRHLLEAKRKSPNILWYPYRSGALVKDTPVLYRLHVGGTTKFRVLHGCVLKTTRNQYVTVAFDNGTQKELLCMDLFLLPPSPVIGRRTTTRKTDDCRCQLTSIWTDKNPERMFGWTIVHPNAVHNGHPRPSVMKLGKRNLELFEELKSEAKELQKVGIPLKYQARLLQHKLGNHYRIDSQPLRRLEQGGLAVTN